MRRKGKGLKMNSENKIEKESKKQINEKEEEI